MINIIEIQQRMTQGVTKPWLCRGDDGKLYVVKRLNAAYLGCIYEWIAAQLGTRFGLPVPDSQLVYIDDLLVEGDDELTNDLGCGIAFASELKDSLQEVNLDRLREVKKSLLLDLFMFDYWIKNSDRTLTDKGGNPNLYYNIVTGDLVVFDHNLAFEHDFSSLDHKSIHAASSVIKGQTDLFTDVIDKAHYQAKFEEAMLDFDAVINIIPQEWLDGLKDADGEIDRIRVLLNDFGNENFWEALA